MQQLNLYITGSLVFIRCKSHLTYRLLNSLYGSMSASAAHNKKSNIELNYLVDHDTASGKFHITFPDQSHYSCSDEGDFLFQFEQHLVVDLQLAQPQYLFLHSAVLAFKNKGIALIAPSGSGKSTTTWGLLHEGFSYLTDEMSAINLDNLNVLAFSHAISLKNQPPAPYALPNDILKTSRAYNIPVTRLPAPLHSKPITLSVILYVKYSPEILMPTIQPISTAESCTHIYTNSLNPLSHPNDGLDAAMSLAQKTQAFILTTGDLKDSCHFIKKFLEQLL